MTNDYSYLWATPGVRYVLVRVEGASGSRLLIWDKEQRGVLLIDDDNLHEAVTQRMLNEGVPVERNVP
jgi:hypothetical protein